MSTQPAPRPRRSVLQSVHPEDADPPPGLRTFVLRLDGTAYGRRLTRSIGGLDDAELDWVARTVLAEQERRASLPPPRVQLGTRELVVLPDGLQFPLKF